VETVGPAVGFKFPMIQRRPRQRTTPPVRLGSDLARLLRLDTTTDKATHRTLDDVTFGEPVFVAHPDTNEEDDGVLPTIGSSSVTHWTEMATWGARWRDIFARITVPIAVPLGFH